MKIFVIGLFLAFGSVSSLRFSHPPITVDSDVILVNKPATLKCNYVKFRTEDIREITWYIGYGGFKGKVRQSNVDFEIGTYLKTNFQICKILDFQLPCHYR